MIQILSEMRRKGPDWQEEGREAFFNAEQNALVAQNAEKYYRTMVRGDAASWNVRDHHMVETLEREGVDVVLLDAGRGIGLGGGLDQHVVDRLVPVLTEGRAAHPDDGDPVADAVRAHRSNLAFQK